MNLLLVVLPNQFLVLLNQYNQWPTPLLKGPDDPKYGEGKHIDYWFDPFSLTVARAVWKAVPGLFYLQKNIALSMLIRYNIIVVKERSRDLTKATAFRK